MLTQFSAAELGRQLASKQISVQEALSASLERVSSHDSLGAFLGLDADYSARWAASAQSLIDSGSAGPLTGVPIAIKDNMCTEGLATTCASKILEGFIPPYDATVVHRLRSAGLVLVGKTNMDEFAMGGSTETSAYKLARNPWNPTLSPGGSSGGSAVAVSAEMVPISLGSDTGGSIRQPAGLCGIVGFKPTYGRVSRYGLVAFASSLDQIGPFGRTVEDVALISEVISGHCHRDSTSLNVAPISSAELKNGSLKGKRFAVPSELVDPTAMEPGVLAVFNQTMDTLRREGAEIVEVSVPAVKLAVTTYYIIAPAEASSNLGRFDGVRYGPRLEGEGHIGGVAATRGKLFGHEVKARIMIGTYALSAGYFDAYYIRAQKVRALMAQEFEKLYQNHDAVLSPTSPSVAFPIGSMDDNPLALKLLDMCTIPANMGGFPGISLNGGYSEGLPVGIQIMGPVMGDENLLQLAYAMEQALPPVQRPPIS